MKREKPTYEELEARVALLDRKVSNLKNWTQLMGVRANDPSFPSPVRQAYLQAYNGLKMITKGL